MWTPIPEFKDVMREIPPPYADVMDWRAMSQRQALRRPDPAPDVVIGRQRTGVTLQQAQSELAAIEKRLVPLYPADLRGTQSLLVPFIESAVGSVRPLLRFIFP